MVLFVLFFVCIMVVKFNFKFERRKVMNKKTIIDVIVSFLLGFAAFVAGRRSAKKTLELDKKIQEDWKETEEKCKQLVEKSNEQLKEATEQCKRAKEIQKETKELQEEIELKELKKKIEDQKKNDPFKKEMEGLISKARSMCPEE